MRKQITGLVVGVVAGVLVGGSALGIASAGPNTGCDGSEPVVGDRYNCLDSTYWQVRWNWDNGNVSTESVSFWEVRGGETPGNPPKVVPVDAEGDNILLKHPNADRVRLLNP